MTLKTGAVLTNASGASVSTNIGVYSTAAAPAVVNSGKILGGAGAGGYGVRFNAGGSVKNFGTIGGAVGVLAQGGAGSVTNYGTIQSPVRLASGFANNVAVAAGAVFQGLVDGGNAIGAPTASTLELLSASSAATLVPANYAHFSQITVDKYATWSLPTGTGVPAGSIVSVSGSLTNNGTVLSPVVLVGGSTFAGALTNAIGATITGANPVSAAYLQNGEAVTLTNAGTITGTATTRGAGAVYLSQDGMVTNQQNALIQGAQFGVWIESGLSRRGSTVVNDGSIITNGASILGQSTYQGAVELGGEQGTSLTNAQNALISAKSVGYGVLVAGSGTISNAGTIRGPGAVYFGSQGDSLSNAVSGVISATAGSAIHASSKLSVVNQGLITSSSAVAVSGRFAASGASVVNQAGATIQGASGVYLGGVDNYHSGPTLVNAGRIAATAPSGYAVYLGHNENSLLVDVPGAVFVGAVNGGNTIGAKYLSTLELASAASTGTLTGLGSQFVNFAQVNLDSGASWSMTGQNSLAAGAYLTDNAMVLDVGGVFLVDGDLNTENESGSVNVAGGRMIVENQAALQMFPGASLDVGQAASGGEGEIDVTGSKSKIVDPNPFTIGDDAVGTLRVDSGGAVTTFFSKAPPDLVIANKASASGSSVNVTGTGSSLQIAGSLTVGKAGFGQLSLSQGAQVTAGVLDEGALSGGGGVIALSGATTGLTLSGDLIVGDQSSGVLSLQNGATSPPSTAT